MRNKVILVTGGAGFIGSSFVNLAIVSGYDVVVLDSLTYAGNIKNLTWISDFDIKQAFYRGDINDREIVTQILRKHEVVWIVNFAAESHVDNSITNANPFISTNVVGTYNLLECARQYYETLTKEIKDCFRFLHVSTDEVFGTLELEENDKFTETSRYNPSSPYSASKAASDHLVRAWHHTYGLPILITNCSNNFGPRQHKEKLIPHMILNALAEKPLTIYGDGSNVRDWIYVDDHNSAILHILNYGKIGETYCIGFDNEKSNNEIVGLICQYLDNIKPRTNNKPYQELITYIVDRKGHDKRYAINNSKLKNQLEFDTKNNFAEQLNATILWYLTNQSWCDQ